MEKDLRIEHPSRGETYINDKYGIYQYDVYPKGSVLEGQQRRRFIDNFETLEEAKKAYPEAVEAGCGYREPYLDHLPDDEG